MYTHDLVRQAERLKRLELARATSHEKRSQLWQQRVGDAKSHTLSHDKKQLRRKIFGVLSEVRRRQELAEKQERYTAKQERVAVRAGLKVAQGMGDATSAALGISVSASPRSPTAARATPSPRRMALLESLTLEELDRLRHDPWFYLEGAILANSSALNELGSLSSSRSEPRLGGRGAAETRKPTAEEKAMTEQGALHSLVDFFTPWLSDKQVPVAEFQRKLRQRALSGEGSAEQRQQQREESAEGMEQAGFQRNSSGQAFGEPLPEDKIEVEASVEKLPSFKASMSLPQLSDRSSRMPCLGRREPVPPGTNVDEHSETFRRVREVFDRRDSMEAGRKEKQLELMAKRSALSEFKAQEHHRERELQAARQKELSSLRTLEALSRKQLVDDLARRRLELRQIEGNKKMACALEQAVDIIEERRQKVTANLELWRFGRDRAAKLQCRQELGRQAAAKARQTTYMQKLAQVAEAHHDFSNTQCQKNDRLKASIQTSLKGQLEDRTIRNNAEKVEAIEAKLEAAAQRRQQALTRSHYNFVEKAFGESPVGYDVRHAVSVDRRTSTWRLGMESTLNMLEQEMAKIRTSSGSTDPDLTEDVLEQVAAEAS